MSNSALCSCIMLENRNIMSDLVGIKGKNTTKSFVKGAIPGSLCRNNTLYKILIINSYLVSPFNDGSA